MKMKNLFSIIIIILVLFNCFINGLLNPNLKSDKAIIAKKVEKDKPFFGLFAIPYIICFFAAKGFWPPYPFFMQRKVDEMGRYVFSMDDNGIRNFCGGIMPINYCFRPFGFKGYLLSKFFCHNNTITTTELPIETIRPTEPPTDPPTTTTTTTTTICACAQPQKLQIENTTLNSLTHILLHATPQPRGRKTTYNPRKLIIGNPTGPFRPQFNPFDWRYATRLPTTTRRPTTRRTSTLVTSMPSQLTTRTQSTTSTPDIDDGIEPTTTPQAIDPTNDVENVPLTTDLISTTTEEILGRIVNQNQTKKTTKSGKKGKTTGKPLKKIKFEKN